MIFFPLRCVGEICYYVRTGRSESVYPHGARGRGRGRTRAMGAVGAGLSCYENPSPSLSLAPGLWLALCPGGYTQSEGLVIMWERSKIQYTNCH